MIRIHTPTLVTIITITASLLTGCASQEPSQPTTTSTGLPDNANHCPQPRADSADRVICPMNYQPVCGIYSSVNANSTYSNACGACAEPTVAGYTEGVCP